MVGEIETGSRRGSTGSIVSVVMVLLLELLQLLLVVAVVAPLAVTHHRHVLLPATFWKLIFFQVKLSCHILFMHVQFLKCLSKFGQPTQVLPYVSQCRKCMQI